MIELVEGAFDPAELLAGFIKESRGSGAVVSFTGICRPDPGVEAIELEAYPGFTEMWINGCARDVDLRFGAYCWVVHRIGRISPGEPIVFVATSAAHRREAFEAADFLMDYLKSRAPFWKKSHGKGGAHWIEPRPEDYEDAARWDGPPKDE